MISRVQATLGKRLIHAAHMESCVTEKSCAHIRIQICEVEYGRGLDVSSTACHQTSSHIDSSSTHDQACSLRQGYRMRERVNRRLL